MADGNTADGDSNAPIDRNSLPRDVGPMAPGIAGGGDIPLPHNADEHFHPPPDAQTDGEDESYPDNLHDVMRVVESEVNSRMRSLWEDAPWEVPELTR